jgi:hypothetical protein
MRKTIIVVLVTALASVVVAEPDQGPYQVLSDGQAKCGEYVLASPQRQEAYIEWIVGFVSGANYESEGTRRLIGGWEHDSLKVWLNNFCNKNPLSVFAAAAQCYREELAKQQGIPQIANIARSCQ